MDAAILIVIVDSACKFHSRVIWPQSHFGSDSLSHPMNSVATPSHHLKFDRVRVTTKLEGNGPIDERATVAEVSVANFNFIFEISNLNTLVSMCMLPLTAI